jgi:hypothetical protein
MGVAGEDRGHVNVDEQANDHGENGMCQTLRFVAESY